MQTVTGKICRQGHRCGYHDEHYRWCWTRGGSWDYCCNTWSECASRGWSYEYCWNGAYGYSGEWQHCEKKKLKKKLHPLCKNYRGKISTTINGNTCQNWNSDQYHKRNETVLNIFNDPKKREEFGLEENYCRAPSLHPTARAETSFTWCYTTNSTTEWEKCDTPACASEPCGRRGEKCCRKTEEHCFECDCPDRPDNGASACHWFKDENGDINLNRTVCVKRTW